VTDRQPLSIKADADGQVWVVGATREGRGVLLNLNKVVEDMPPDGIIKAIFQHALVDAVENARNFQKVKGRGISEYLRRNLLVAKCHGVMAGAKYCSARLATHERIPHWLMQRLLKIERQMEEITPELVAYRDMEKSLDRE